MDETGGEGGDVPTGFSSMIFCVLVWAAAMTWGLAFEPNSRRRNEMVAIGLDGKL